ncbi:MAG: helix-turn-helix domain-containing protein [Colwellia sp.]
MSSKMLSPLAKRLREARKNAGFTQEQLGIKAGIDEGVVSARMSQYENNVHTPDFSFIKKVATILGLPTAYFYCEEDELAQIIKAFND